MDCGREEEFRYQVISLFTILNLPVYKYFFTLDRAVVGVGGDEVADQKQSDADHE